MSKTFPLSLALTIFCAGSLLASDEIDLEMIAEQQVVKSADCKMPPPPQKKCETPPAKKCAPAPVKKVDPCAVEPVLPTLPCPNHWRVSGAFLYLLPTLDDTYYVINSDIATVIPNGERENNDFGFKTAFRVGAEWASCKKKQELQAFYTHLSAHQDKTLSGSHLWGTLGRADLTSSFENYSGTASSNLSLMYQRVDVNFVQQMSNHSGLYCSVQPGIEYAYLRLDENYTYQFAVGATNGVIDQKSRAWGVGPQIGMSLDYDFYQGSCCWGSTQAFSFTSVFSGSILMGRHTTDNFQTLTGSQIVSTQDEHTWRTIPALHARLGLNYAIVSSCAGGSIGIGYEFNTYLRGLSRTVFPDDVADSLCTTEYYNFDVQGLYVSAAISF